MKEWLLMGIDESLKARGMTLSPETVQDIVENIGLLRPHVLQGMFLTKNAERSGVPLAISSQENWDHLYKAAKGLSLKQKKILISVFKTIHPRTEKAEWAPKSKLSYQASNATSNTLKTLEKRGLVIRETKESSPQKAQWNRTCSVRLTILGYITVCLLIKRKKIEQDWGKYS
jgi:hypothetical protein